MSDASSLPLFAAAPRSEAQGGLSRAPAAGDLVLEGGARFALRRGDAIDLLRSLPSGSVDLMVTDPAYESLEKHRAIGTTTRLKHSKSSSNDWFAIFPNARFPELFAEAHRVLRRNAHLYLFCDQETMFVAKPMAEDAGFRFWKAIVWDKVALGMGYHYRSRHEMILFLEKGKRKLADLSVPDVLRVPRVHRGYPSEKPAEVSEILIRQSALPGELVVDPFCGSGSVGVAALRQGRRFLGGDVSSAAIAVAAERLASEAGGAAALSSAPAAADEPA
jgi:site-specific DNA-methyltransferase (adenine-specific)